MHINQLQSLNRLLSLKFPNLASLQNNCKTKLTHFSDYESELTDFQKRRVLSAMKLLDEALFDQDDVSKS
jgi:hypothetical protein